MSSEYENLKRKLDESIRKDEARQKILRKKREEKRTIKKAGGGHALTKAIMGGTTGDDTDFDYGNNSSTTGPIQDEAPVDETNPEYRCMGRTLCEKCGRFHGYCIEVHEDQEKLKMLPTGRETESSGRGTKRPGGMEWVKNEDLSTTPKEAKILMVRVNKEGRFGTRVELKLAFDGKIKFWGVPPNIDNTNYSLLTEKFGLDENDWVDKRFLLFLEKNNFTEQYFIRVAFSKEADARRSR